MSEYAPKTEHQLHHEKLVDEEHRARLEKTLSEKAQEAKAELAANDIEALREKAEMHAEPSEHIKPDQQNEPEPDALLGMQQILKTKAYDHTLKRIRQKLPKPARVFSQFAHNKVVEAASNAGAQTVGRPSGILGGSLCAFTGSVIVLYYSRHYGFTYNYALFLLLFIGGFLIGVVAELLIWFTYSRKQH
ncbi:MAG TPA: hypothetical protein VM124_04030 [Candidatus Limnocylindrales bacterium]|nr:hypothetical protein [Candidatus Limnocylindrales bacterium]